MVVLPVGIQTGCGPKRTVGSRRTCVTKSSGTGDKAVSYTHLIGYCLYFSSLGDLKGQEAAILSYIDPLVACAMSVFVMGEAMGLMQAAGGVMILGFTLYNELGGKTPSHPRQKTGCE